MCLSGNAQIDQRHPQTLPRSRSRVTERPRRSPVNVGRTLRHAWPNSDRKNVRQVTGYMEEIETGRIRLGAHGEAPSPAG